MDGYKRLNEWMLMSTVEDWATGAQGPERAELGRAWQDMVARRLKWRLVFQSYAEAAHDTVLLRMTRQEFASRIRACLPPDARDTVFEVDVARQAARFIDPETETSDVVFYDPLDDTYERSAVGDLFRRLPERMSLFRIFARDERHREELTRAARRVLREG
jgi:hypothetical protein